MEMSDRADILLTARTQGLAAEFKNWLPLLVTCVGIEDFVKFVFINCLVKYSIESVYMSLLR